MSHFFFLALFRARPRPATDVTLTQLAELWSLEIDIATSALKQTETTIRILIRVGALTLAGFEIASASGSGSCGSDALSLSCLIVRAPMMVDDTGGPVSHPTERDLTGRRTDPICDLSHRIERGPVPLGASETFPDMLEHGVATLP